MAIFFELGKFFNRPTEFKNIHAKSRLHHFTLIYYSKLNEPADLRVKKFLYLLYNEKIRLLSRYERQSTDK